MSEKTKNKLVDMIKNQKPGKISIRKYDPSKDPTTCGFDKIKLDDKYREKHKSKQFYSYYVSKENLRDFKKRADELEKTTTEGGFIPALIAALPLIFGAAASLGGVASGVSSIVKAVNDKKANDLQLEEDKRYHEELLAQTKETPKEGGCVNCDDNSDSEDFVYKDFVKSLNLLKGDRKLVKNILNGLGKIARITKQGNGLYLSSLSM